MDLDKKINEKKKALNASVAVKGVMSNEVLELSQHLDKLIVRRMRRVLA